MVLFGRFELCEELRFGAAKIAGCAVPRDPLPG
jgi:hypothetical protein